MLAQALQHTYLLIYYLDVVIFKSDYKILGADTQLQRGLVTQSTTRGDAFPATAGMKTRTSFTRKTYLRLLKD